jgi:hypothetical protein
MTKNGVPLTDLPQKLREMYPGQRIPTYRQCYVNALDAAFPTEKDGQRYIVTDVPAVAEVFGLAEMVQA